MQASPDPTQPALSGVLSWIQKRAVLLLLLLLLGDGALGLYRDHLSLNYPQATQHFSYVVMSRFARVLQGWRPVGHCNVGWDCAAGFDAPSAEPRSWWEATRWIWDQGHDYNNAYPLYVLPAAVFVTLIPGSAAIAALGLRFWFALLLGGTFQLGRMLRGPLTGLLAAVLACGTPGLFGLSLVHQDSIPLATVTVWMAVLLLSSEGFSRLANCVGVVLLTLLAFRLPENTSGTLLVALSVFAPFVTQVHLAVGQAWQGVKPLRRLLGLVLIVAPPVLIAIYWRGREYAWHYVWYGAANGDIGTPAAPNINWFAEDAVLPFQQLGYIEELARHLVWMPLVFFVWFGLCVSFRDRSRTNLGVLGMHLIPLVLLSFTERLGNWYIIPALPALVVGGASGLTALQHPRLRAALCAGALLAASYERGALTFWQRPRTAADVLLHKVLVGNFVIEGPRATEGAAAHGIADVVDALPNTGTPHRVLVISAVRQRGLATCWIVRLDDPMATCLSPLWGLRRDLPGELLDPNRYDVLAWIEQDGLREIPLGAPGPLPSLLQESINRMDDSARYVAHKVMDHLSDVEWVRLHTPVGPVYVRADMNSVVPGEGSD